MSNKLKSENSIYSHNRIHKRNFKIFLAILVDFVLFTAINFCVAYTTNSSNFHNSDYYQVVTDYTHILIVGLLNFVIIWIMGLYRSVWQYISYYEIIRGVISSTISAIMLYAVDGIIYYHALKKGIMSPIAYILAYILIIWATIIPRIVTNAIRKNSRFFKKSNDVKVKRVMIVGAGYMGNFVIDSLRSNNYSQGKPVIAVDDDPAKYHKIINGVKVVGTCRQIPELVKRHKIDTIIVSLPSASKKRQNEIISTAMQTNAEVKISPSVEDMFEKGGNRRVRKVDITDLLSRPEVKLDKKVCHYLIGKTILVTGGGGSIGSELCSQVARYNPKTIVIFDIYENCAFETENYLLSKYDNNIDIQIRIGSIRDINRLREVFEEFHPDVVFHAAAHKHVPLMEDSPCEAVKNNVFGTYNVAKIVDEFKVPKMVILSTDKAVNPTNVMGCTKRITEIIVQYMNSKSESSQYSAVRFGNVLGSHGSVIPIFKKQIEKGGPIKVTHPDITRYFMTIPEAAQLVCQAGGLANGGEVFVLDMGEPVKIIDLAKNLIRLSGFTEDEIGIEIVGLRPGEKLYEELAMDSEIQTRQKTANEKIFVNQPMEIDDNEFKSMLNSLKDINNDNVREKLMAIIPNYHPTENQ